MATTPTATCLPSATSIATSPASAARMEFQRPPQRGRFRRPLAAHPAQVQGDLSDFIRRRGGRARWQRRCMCQNRTDRSAGAKLCGHRHAAGTVGFTSADFTGAAFVTVPTSLAQTFWLLALARPSFQKLSSLKPALDQQDDSAARTARSGRGAAWAAARAKRWRMMRKSNRRLNRYWI